MGIDERDTEIFMGIGMTFENGKTPLDESESEGLLIKTILTQEDLNEVEQLNIEEAVEWTIRVY